MVWLQTTTPGLLVLCIAAIALLLFLIMKLKLEPFIALFICGILLALAAGLSVKQIVGTGLSSAESLIDTGFGTILGHVAILIGLGTVMGAFLERSGGANLIADKLIGIFGQKGAPLAMGLVGFLFGIPIFWDVTVFMLASLVYVVAKQGTQNLVRYAVPTLAGITAAHVFLPPHPGPAATGSMLNVNLGWVLAFGFIAAIPAFIASMIYSSWISRRQSTPIPEDFLVTAESSDSASRDSTTAATKPASIAAVLLVIIAPLILILGATFGTIALPSGQFLTVLTFIGSPAVALAIATVLAYWLLGIRQGISAKELGEVSSASLRPLGMVLLTIGGGAFFGKVIGAAGVGTALTSVLAKAGLPILVTSFLIATAMRLAQGSTTVAIVTAAGIIGPTLGGNYSQMQLALLAVAMCAGGGGWSFVNDAGFWIVSRMFNMGVKQTVVTWSAMSTILALVGFAVAAILWIFI